MLRTNTQFLSYIETLWDNQERKGEIVLKSYNKGDRIFSQNETATKASVIKDGIAKCLVEENDKEYLVEFLGKGEIAGEIETIKSMPCVCTIEAVTFVDVFQISISYFNFLLEKDLQFNRFLVDILSERLKNTTSRSSYQQLNTLEHSLSKLLKLLPKQEINVSKDNLASYLGISTRSLNRVLKKISEGK